MRSGARRLGVLNAGPLNGEPFLERGPERKDSNMEKTALLLVDVQKALVEGHPYREEEFLRNTACLLEAARRNRIEVIYVRHDGGSGDELEAGTKGWNIHSAVLPLPSEKIFDKKYNSAFKDTGLRAYLEARGVRNLVLLGMQTEYCIDATCKAAFEYGYSVAIPVGATTTFDNELLTGAETVRYYERNIWDGRFAELLPVGEAVERMNRAGTASSGAGSGERKTERNCRISSLYLCVRDMDRAIRFYEEFLEQPVTIRGEVYSVFDIHGFRLGLFAYRKKNERHTFGNSCLPSIELDSLNVLNSKLENRKIVFPLTRIGANWVAEMEDSEGNSVEITAPVSEREGGGPSRP